MSDHVPQAVVPTPVGPARPAKTWRSVFPVAILAGGVALSAAAAAYVRHTNRIMDEAWLNDHASQVQHVIRERLEDFGDALIHTRTFFGAGRALDQRALHSYLEQVGVFRKYPGVLGIGVLRPVRAAQLPAFVREMRKTIPGFHVWPEGPRELYMPLTYYEPPTPENQRVLGFDTSYWADRREVQLRAVRNDEPSATSKIVLVRDTSGKPSPGFVMFLPIYKPGMPVATPEQREKAMIGMLNTVFRTRRFIESMLDETQVRSDIAFDVFDGDTPSPGSLLYRLRPNVTAIPDLQRIDHVKVGGRTWTFRFYPAPAFGTFWSRQGHWLVLLGGTLMSVLLYQFLRASIRREETERELVAQVRQALDARDEFISIAAHELRTPITSLRLQLQMATRYGRSEPARSLERVAQAGLQQVTRLTELINELLDVTRIQSGKLRVNTQSTDLCQLVRELADHYRDSADATGNLLLLNGSREPVLADVDPLRLGQAVENLLSNAIKYGANRPIEIYVEKLPGHGVIRVRDFGIGIPADRQERIFRRFERAVGPDAVGGLGLGLYIAKQIVDAHHGSIRVDSAPGEGSTFSIELPLAERVG